ncbi:hypothetical protein [Membranihabitans marinus]|uniref:hypothetical protein n=1 Tax=Membranihabitans marinus TaxID=1227546 RepID=UPI001F31B9C7|nr:hypothetical protein [Membranihabitans marinus]
MKLFFFSLALAYLLLPNIAQGQIYLQIEKIGSTRTMKIPIGAEIKVKLKDRDYYIDQEIVNIIPDESVIITTTEVFFVGDIEHIIPRDNYHRKGRFFIYPIYSLGISGTVAGIIGTIYELKLRPELLLPGPAVWGLAILFQKWFDRPFVKEKGWRFRVVDLRMSVPED